MLVSQGVLKSEDDDAIVHVTCRNLELNSEVAELLTVLARHHLDTRFLQVELSSQNAVRPALLAQCPVPGVEMWHDAWGWEYGHADMYDGATKAALRLTASEHLLRCRLGMLSDRGADSSYSIDGFRG